MKLKLFLTFLLIFSIFLSCNNPSSSSSDSNSTGGGITDPSNPGNDPTDPSDPGSDPTDPSNPGVGTVINRSIKLYDGNNNFIGYCSPGPSSITVFSSKSYFYTLFWDGTIGYPQQLWFSGTNATGSIYTTSSIGWGSIYAKSVIPYGNTLYTYSNKDSNGLAVSTHPSIGSYYYNGTITNYIPSLNLSISNVSDVTEKYNEYLNASSLYSQASQDYSDGLITLTERDNAYNAYINARDILFAIPNYSAIYSYGNNYFFFELTTITKSEAGIPDSIVLPLKIVYE